MYSGRGTAVKARLLFSPVAWMCPLLSVLLGLPIVALALDLSVEERAWLDAHPVIRVGVDVDWAPVEFVDQDGRLQGISADYLALLQQQLGVRFTAATELNWQDTLAAVKGGELDMLSSVKRTPARETYLAFTDTYVSMPIMIFAGPEVSYIGSLKALDGYKVAVVNGTVINQAEFDSEMNRVLERLQRTGRFPNDLERSQIKKQVLENLIARELLYQESQKKGIKVDQKEIEAQLTALKGRFPSEVEFKKALRIGRAHV